MKHHVGPIMAMAFALLSMGCGPSQTEGSVRCLVEGFGAPMCMFYEFNGPDSESMDKTLRDSCVDAGQFELSVVDACPDSQLLAGCKVPRQVEGGADVEVFLTTYYYEGEDAFGTPYTRARMELRCEQERGEFIEPDDASL